MQSETHFFESFENNTGKLYYFLQKKLYTYSILHTKLITALSFPSSFPSSTLSSANFSTPATLTCIYSRKLLVLSLCLFMSATSVVGQQWVGLFSETPNSSVLTSTGSTNNTSEVSIKIPGFFIKETVIAGKSYQYPEIPDGQPIQFAGIPELQKLNFTLQLPAAGDVEVSMVSAEFKDYPDFEILPTIGNAIAHRTAVMSVKGDANKTDAFYPNQLIDSDLPFTIRNTRNQTFEVSPFQYNPTTHVLRFYYDLKFKIINIGGEGVHPLSSNDLKIIPINGLGVTPLNKHFNATRTCNTGPLHGSMLIICTEEFQTAIAPLVKWRSQTGVSTRLVVAKQFTDSAEIHRIVKKQYSEDSTFAYLLLVGDSKQVPTNMLKNIASDNYYSYLSGIQPDSKHYPDIMVGRFSAETVKDVEVQVKRTLEYEMSPGADGNWLGKVTGIGSQSELGNDSEFDYIHIRRLLETLKSTTYVNSNEFFDGSQGLGDANGDPSASAITSKINEGTGVIFYAGHGSPNGWTTGSFTTGAVNNLNNSGKYPIIWSASCQTGSFVNNFCFAESWLRATDSKGKPAGAVAALMASGLQPAPPATAAQLNITELLGHPQNGLSTMGAITINSLIKMNRDGGQGNVGYETTNSWVLFGDPALNIRTTKPKKLIVSHKGTINLGSDNYSLVCNATDGYACISKDGNILGTASLIEGKATIKLTQHVVGDSLTLTVTAFNYLPYISVISISEKPGDIENPSPLNHSYLQSISKLFSWEKGEGESPLYYLFSLGTDNPPSNLIDSKKITTNQFAPELKFDYDKKYYWQVIPVSAKGQAEGKVLDFTTIGEPDEDFESDFKTSTTWLNEGVSQWEMDAANFFDGQHALRSGHIQNNEYSSLSYPCEVQYCDFVSFWARTSSSQGDMLQFSIDSVIIGEWGGNMDWSFQVFHVDPGMHQFEWRYTKDNS
ncbi:MAG: C25 family cysteine peptidase, partial [Bacteroidales bacterium]